MKQISLLSLGFIALLLLIGVISPSKLWANSAFEEDHSKLLLAYLRDVGQVLDGTGEFKYTEAYNACASANSLSPILRGDLYIAMYILSTDDEFRMQPTQVEKLFKKIIDYGTRPLKDQIKGFRFTYFPKHSPLPNTIRVKFDRRGRALLRIPGSKITKGASKKAELFLQFGEWKKWIRLSNREKGITNYCVAEMAILRKIGALKGPMKMGLIPDIGQTETEIFLTFFEGTLGSWKWRRQLKGEMNSIINQLLHGLQTLHHLEIAHGDIHPNNILLRKTRKGMEAVIADFDQSVDLSHINISSYRQDSAHPVYAAPEVTRSIRYPARNEEDRERIKKRDVFSIGIILHDLLKGSRPPLLEKCNLSESPSWKCYEEGYLAKHSTLNSLEKDQNFDPLELLLDRALDSDVERRISSTQLLDGWILYNKIDQAATQKTTEPLPRIPLGPELRALGIQPTFRPEEIINLLKTDVPGSFLILPIFSTSKRRQNGKVRIYYRDFEGVRNIEFKALPYDLATIESKVLFLKTIGILKKPHETTEVGTANEKKGI